VKPKKSNVSGLLSPRSARLCAAKRPNSINRCQRRWKIRPIGGAKVGNFFQF
jgi:hypothetical protein